MDIKEKIHQELKICNNYIREISAHTCICLVHENWLSELLHTQNIPVHFIEDQDLTGTECNILLSLSLSHEDKEMKYLFERPWRLLCISVLPKSENIVRWKQDEPLQKLGTMRYWQLISFISENNFKNSWKEAYRKYAHMIQDPGGELELDQPYTEYVRHLLGKLYHCPFIHTQNSPEENIHNSSEIGQLPNCLNAFCIVESEFAFYILKPYIQFNMHDCVTLSPAVLGTSIAKSLFIFYQILQAIRCYHENGMTLGDFHLHNMLIDRKLWVYLSPSIPKNNQISINPNINPSISNLVNISPQDIKNTSLRELDYRNQRIQTEISNGIASCKLNQTPNLIQITHKWIRREMSNFDYLMNLNTLAGRRMGDPNHHPIIPWVIDFTSPNTGWRDLTKSKFRLNKGDNQLDITYDSMPLHTLSALDSISNIPHHVSDVLSEITYYVYKARQIPRSILCKSIRSNWVAAEYPASMERMQRWTPDECIPEFFTDPSIFKSIHDDLPDLAVPSWCISPEDFVKKHLAALESDYVSERLHSWIDITFGHKLSGSAAVKSKNVVLHLVDQHTTLRKYGVVQLFHHPHPKRLTREEYFSPIPPDMQVFSHLNSDSNLSDCVKANEFDFPKGNTFVPKISDLPEMEDQILNVELLEVLKLRKTSLKLKADNITDRNKSSSIILPESYDPLKALRRVETLFNFATKTARSSLEDPEQSVTCEKVLDEYMRDLLNFGCLIVEVFLASKLRILSYGASLEQRYQLIHRVCSTDFNDIPRCLQSTVKLLLQLDQFCLPEQLPNFSQHGLPKGFPPPSAGLLLQPYFSVLPFPDYFPNLYNFLCSLNKISGEIEDAELANINTEEKQELINNLVDSKVKLMASCLPKIIPNIKNDGLELLLPFIEEAFENKLTSISAAWYLFDIVGKALGPRQTYRKIVPLLMNAYVGDNFTMKHMKLFHRTFLLQLIVRLGMQNFLNTFINPLIEAAAALKDFESEASQRLNSVTDDILHPESSHLKSPELDNFTQNVFPDTESITAPSEDDSSDRDPSLLEPELEVFSFEPNPEDTDEQSVSEDSPFLESGNGIGMSSTSEMSGENKLISDLESSSSLSLIQEHWNQEESDSRIECEDLGDDDTISDSQDLELLEVDQQDKSVLSGRHEIEKCQSSPPPAPSRSPQEFSLYNICDVAIESIIWLSHRLGPVLTAKYLTRNLLRVLSLCYMESNLHYISGKEDGLSICNKLIAGDLHSSKALKCLTSVAALYGESIILWQYLPHAKDVISNSKTRLTANGISGVIGCLVLVKHVIPYLSDTTIMNNLKELLSNILQPVVKLICSINSAFPLDLKAPAREMITYKILDVIYLVCLRIGREMSRKHMTPLLQRFFRAFNCAHERQDEADLIEAADLVEEPEQLSRSTEDNAYFEIKKDAETNEYTIGSPIHLNLPEKNKTGVLINPSSQVDHECASEVNSPANSKRRSSGESSKEERLAEMRSVFNPELAHIAYVSFCRLIGGIHMEQKLSNDELIRHLCMSHDETLEKNKAKDEDKAAGPQTTFLFESGDPLSDDPSSQIGNKNKNDSKLLELPSSRSFGENAAVIGNRIEIQLDETNFPQIGIEPGTYDEHLISKKMKNTQRHLENCWLAYWLHEIGRSDRDFRFDFKQIKLQTFLGHTSTVRSLIALDNENSFISASKDKTVKLWSLRNQGDGSTQHSAQWTYQRHKKSVFSIAFLESMRLVASCDSTVHIWDPIMGYCLNQFDSSKTNPVHVLASMPAPSTNLITATADGTLRFLDTRIFQFVHEFKVTPNPAGVIRGITVSPNGNWVAVGHSSGVISVLDVRTGLSLNHWKAHEGEILQIKCYNSKYFVTSSLDNHISVWDTEDYKLRCHLKGPNEAVHCFCFYHHGLISGTTSNRIGVHTSLDSSTSFSSSRFPSDSFRGVLTSMAVLPLNRLLLLGADNGMIRLFY